MFLSERKLKNKERIEENYVTTFNTLKSAFICQCKKTILKIEFQKPNFKSIFAVYKIQKSAWNNPCTPSTH